MLDGIFHKGNKDADPGSYAEKEKWALIIRFVNIIFWIPYIAAALLSGSITLFADMVTCGNEIISTLLSSITLRKLNRGNKEVYK